MRLKIFIDMDGVITDWLTPACQALNVDINDPTIRTDIKNGKLVEDIVGENAEWSAIAINGPDWWEELKLLPWANDIIEISKLYGDIAFLSSPGNLKKYPVSASLSCHGKVRWVKNHYEDIPLILTQSKYFCAGPNTVLIDDSTVKIKEFEKHGGNTFKWKCQYLMMDGDINWKDELHKLEVSLYNLWVQGDRK